MRILIFNVNAFDGSTGKITKGLYDYLIAEGHEVKVCYRGVFEKRIDNKDFIPLGKKLFLNISVFLARLTGLEGHFNFWATIKVLRLIKRFRPDLVQLYNLHGNYINSYQLLKFLNKSGIPTAYSMLDEYPYMGKCAYPTDCERFKTECNNCPQKDKYPESWVFDQSRKLFHLKEKCYDGFDKIVFTGPPYVCQRAKESFLLRNKKVEVLYEPFNFEDCFYPRKSEALKQELGIKEKDIVVVCASGTYFRKGGHFFVEAALRLQNEPHIKFVFIGYDESAKWDFPSNVIVKGWIRDQNLFAEYMSMGDAFVCTSIGDTTPSVCLCALGCGTPIIGFDYGGVKDCAPEPFGTYVPMKDVNAMAAAIKMVQKKTAQDIDKIREYAIGRFSQQSVYSKQLELYYKILSER